MNSFGRLFRVSILGESHGPCVGVLLDGVPAGVPLAISDFEPDMLRRQGGRAKGTTPRQEKDQPRILSGLYQGFTTGSPLLLEILNENTDSGAYGAFQDHPRPGHADWVALQKFKGFSDMRGSGHFSGRLTAPLVAAGVVAKTCLSDIHIQARLLRAGGREDIEAAIEEAMTQGDSVGGLVECRVQNLPAGLGEPFFDSLESLLAHAIFSIPAIKALEFGDGWASQSMRGSDYNDLLTDAQGRTATNHSGGINGGISNGNELIFRVAVKPTASITREQKSMELTSGTVQALSVKGRHDACIALRVPVILEAVTALVLADLMLLEGRLPRVMASR